MKSKQVDKPLEDVVFFLIEKVNRKGKLISQREMDQAGLGVTIDQWVCLKKISQSDGISQKELAAATLKDAPTVTRILDLLQNKGLVEKRVNDDDRRVFDLHLTQEGRGLVLKAMPLILELRQQAIEGIGEGEIKVFKNVLNKMLQNLK